MFALLGYDVKIIHKTLNSPVALFAQYQESLAGLEYLLIINECGGDKDDVAKVFLKDLLGQPLEENLQILQHLKKNARKSSLSPQLESLARLPKDCIPMKADGVLPPAYSCTNKEQMLWVLPHQPNDLFPLLVKQILPVFTELRGP